MIILDTNVVSELMKLSPSEKVMKWVASRASSQLFTSTVTEAEILYGVHPVFETLKSGRRKVEQIHVLVGRQDRKVRSILALASLRVP